MTKHVETFIKKTNRTLDLNLAIQELLSEAAMRVDTAQENQDKLLRFVKNSPHLSGQELDSFCAEQEGRLDNLIAEQNFLMDEIKNMVRTMDSYTMRTFLNQNMLAYLNKVNGIKIKSGEPLLGQTLPSQKYYEHPENTKGN